MKIKKKKEKVKKKKIVKARKKRAKIGNIETSDVKEVKSLFDIAVSLTASTDEDITEEQLIGVINKIASIHQVKKFGYFEEEDIKGQVWIICLQQMQQYCPEKGKGTSVLNNVERWLNRVVKNRLRTFYRDHYTSTNEQFRINRMNLVNFLGIQNVDLTSERNIEINPEDPDNSLIFDELSCFVEDKLDDEHLEIYYACLDQENVTPYYKNKLKAQLLDIFEQWRELHKYGE